MTGAIAQAVVVIFAAAASLPVFVMIARRTFTAIPDSGASPGPRGR
ncbi:MAG: hypothetical protein HYU62_13795 [Caulobacterales bacterium]|nr:hypothetical protein [Caulobacterales bacterium]